MINPSIFIKELKKYSIEMFTGVPDSLLKSFCAYVQDHSERNIITANEGNAIALAAGHYLATKHIACVYMQNSGLGNAVNPLISLMDSDVYQIPVLLMIGYRGEPGVKDEPQHVKQGKITLSLLETLCIDYLVIDGSEDVAELLAIAQKILLLNKPFAFVVKKGTFEEYKIQTPNDDISNLTREHAIEIITTHLTHNELIVSTTGMISRELFEIRERNSESHATDFLTVGSMGHTSQIAMGVALSAPHKKVICLDGDGSFIMHMGSVVVNSSLKAKNLVHIILNNGAHDSVGGQPTVASSHSLSAIASSCGYESVLTVDNEIELIHAMKRIELGDVQLLEVKVKKGARKDLIRPTISPKECKENFMGTI